jgi:peroxiredoxin family protein
MAKMTIGLGSGCIDKLTSLGVILSGAAADDMEVDVFVLLNAGGAFLKNKKADYSCSDQNAEEFTKALQAVNSPGWIEFFEMAKEMTTVKVYMCSLAGKVVGGEKIEDFIDLVDEICGIGEYITSVQESDVNLFI